MRILNKSHWPHQVVVRIDYDRPDVDAWCSNTVGKKFVDWFSFSVGHGALTYAFRDEETLLMFSIAWNCKKI